MSERRAKAFWVSEDTVWRLIWVRWRLPNFINLPFLDGLPSDVQISHVRHDPFRRAFWFVLHHPSFPLWNDGADCPEGGQLHYDIVEINTRPGEAYPIADAYATLVEENGRLRAVFGDFRQDDVVTRLAYDQGVLDERRRCAYIVETGGADYPGLLESCIQQGVNAALAAIIRSGLEPERAADGEGAP